MVEICEENLLKGNINLQSVKERIRARYSWLQKTNESDKAIALMMKTQYKKACPLCGKFGHKGADCFTLEKNRDKKEAYINKQNKIRIKSKNCNHKNRWNRNNNWQQDDDCNNNMAMTGINKEMILIANNCKNIQSTHLNWQPHPPSPRLPSPSFKPVAEPLQTKVLNLCCHGLSFFSAKFVSSPMGT